MFALLKQTGEMELQMEIKKLVTNEKVSGFVRNLLPDKFKFMFNSVIAQFIIDP